MRPLEIFQSVLSMLEVQDALAVKVLTRSLLEDNFVLVDLQRDPALMDSCLAQDEKSTIGILKGFRKMAGQSSDQVFDVRDIDREISVRQKVECY